MNKTVPTIQMRKWLIIILLIIVTIGFGQVPVEYHEIRFDLNVEQFYCKYGDNPPVMNESNSVLFIIPSGTYEFHFEKNNYTPSSKTYTVNSDQIFEITLNRDNSQQISRITSSVINIQSNPSDARVLLNGQLIESTPLSKQLISGSYKLKIEKPKHYAQERDIYLAVNENINQKFDLKPIYGLLYVKVKPPNADILINGIHRGNAPLSLNLFEGEYKLEADYENFLPFSQLVTIERNKTRNVSIWLNHYSVYNNTQQNKWKRRRGLSLLSTVLLVGAGYLADNTADNYYDDYLGSDTKADAEKYRSYTLNSNLAAQISYSVSITTFLAMIYSHLKVSKYDQ